MATSDKRGAQVRVHNVEEDAGGRGRGLGAVSVKNPLKRKINDWTRQNVRQSSLQKTQTKMNNSDITNIFNTSTLIS